MVSFEKEYNVHCARKGIYNIFIDNKFVFYNNVKEICEFKKLYSRTMLIRLENLSLNLEYIIFITTYYCSRCFENCTVEQLDELEEHYM